MRKTKFQRLMALMLAFVFLLTGSVLGVSASDATKDGVMTTEQIKAILNAISYEEYLESNKDVPRGESEIVIDATKGYEYVVNNTAYNAESEIPEGADLAQVKKYDEVAALYIPGSGTVSWQIDAIKTATKYSIVIDYYPVEGKPASIERTFQINGNVPFAEARYLTIPKVWNNVYADGEFLLGAGESEADYLNRAASLGIEARSEARSDGTYIIYKMPDVWTQDICALTDELALRFFVTDIDNNEIRSGMVQAPAWSTYEFRDSNGFYAESFEFVLEPDEKTGVVTLSLESVNEPIAISQIRLVPHEGAPSYEEYLAKYAGAPDGTDAIKLEAEYYSATSTQTIYPSEDRTSAVNSPSAIDRSVLNTIGGEKWQTAGQWVEYTFSVGASGMYDIFARYHQNVLDGMFVSRALYIYSEGLEPGQDGYYNGLPFSEANNLRFDFDSDWRAEPLNDGRVDEEEEKVGFKFYFAQGVKYTIRFEVVLGSMGDIVNTVQASLESINRDYLNILKLTGTSPDEYRDYGFARVMPDTMIDLILQSQALDGVAKDLAAIAGGKSSMTATLEKIARLLSEMGGDEDAIAKSLSQLKTDIGSLGTWVGNAKTQPLQFDYLTVQGASTKAPKAEANFWESLVFEIGSFFKSFFRNYDRMGAMEEISKEDSVEVWLAYGRDQSQVIRNLINNDFTSQNNIPINLKLVAGGTLLPSILSGRGPDVYIGLGQGDVINYAIRGALIELENMAGFEEAVADFNEAAMITLEIEDSEGQMHTYGVPETQNFNMMFVREDILAELDIEIPQTWDDVLEAIPTLQANNMEIGMHTDYKIFMYQKGGELFADGGMRINLDSNLALESFETMCNMFTMYSFPYKYDFANRFRTGEMPIGFAGYTGTYNQLKVFATELEGVWGFYPMPGYADAEGNVNRESVSSVTAIVMITGCEDQAGAWEFMKWHAGADCQIKYSNEMVAIIGPSAKHPTANIQALASLPWTSAEYAQVNAQFTIYGLSSIPNYPGSYIIDRYTNFAFLAAYNDNADPITELQSYITTINKEITRKRQEFDLETLDYIGQTLAEKRMTQAIAAIEAAKSNGAYSSAYDLVCQRAIDVMNGGDSEDYASIASAAIDLRDANPTLFGAAADYMTQASNSLIEYEKYK